MAGSLILSTPPPRITMEEHVEKLNKAAREFIKALREFDDAVEVDSEFTEEQFDQLVQDVIDNAREHSK
jgi:Sec-independent protein translocase protein TatA